MRQLPQPYQRHHGWRPRCDVTGLAGSGRAGETDRHGLPNPPRRVIDPGLHFGSMLPGGAAFKINRIGDAPWSRDALVRTGEGIRRRHPARAVDAREAESPCVIAGVRVLDVEIDL